MDRQRRKKMKFEGQDGTIHNLSVEEIIEVAQARKALDAAKTRLSGLKHALEEIWQWSREAIKPDHYPRRRRVQALMSVYNKIEKAEEVLEEAEEKYQKAYKTYARSRFF
jgi:succinate dehydrogenase/fumarate reductase flavoprotein subunit